MTSTVLPSGTRVVDVSGPEALPAALDEIGLSAGRPVVVVIGGAARIDAALLDLLYPLVRDGVVAPASRLGALLIDGGTDSGIMALAGRARAELGAEIVLMGVAPKGRVAAPGVDGGGATALEPNHSHVLLVPGDEWGSESPFLVETARRLAGDRPVVTVLFDGGPIALSEAMACAAQGWPIVAVAGTGRSADVLAGYARGATDTRLAETDRRGIYVVEIAAGSAGLADAVGRLISRPSTGAARAAGATSAAGVSAPAAPEIRSGDYPALYLAASEAAKRGQTIHKRLSLGEILMTTLGLTIALLTGLIFGYVITDPGSAVVRNLIVGTVTALVFLTALVLKFINRSSGFDTDWYSGRALAETVKGLAWRYMMRVEPYAAADHSVDRRLRLDLAGLLRRQAGFRQAVDRLPVLPQQISPRMRAVRTLPLPDRRDLYLTGRVLDQARWYQRRGASASRWSGRWYWLSVATQLAGAGVAIWVAATGADLLRVIAIAGAVALAMAAWSQLNRYDELSRSYGVALQELLLIAAVGEQVSTEGELAELVGDAEEAIGREHRLWMARRADLPEEETGEDELDAVGGQ